MAATLFSRISSMAAYFKIDLGRGGGLNQEKAISMLSEKKYLQQICRSLACESNEFMTLIN